MQQYVIITESNNLDINISSFHSFYTLLHDILFTQTEYTKWFFKIFITVSHLGYPHRLRADLTCLTHRSFMTSCRYEAIREKSISFEKKGKKSMKLRMFRC